MRQSVQANDRPVHRVSERYALTMQLGPLAEVVVTRGPFKSFEIRIAQYANEVLNRSISRFMIARSLTWNPPEENSQ